MHKRYGGYKNVEELKLFYRESIKEFSRVISGGGVLTIKCQDIVSGRKNYFIHIYIHDLAIEFGFTPKDIFVLVNHNKFKGNIKKQQHARKHHSYFWVFKKNR